MNIYVLALVIITNLILLLPVLAKAESKDVEQEYYDGMGSSGWSYDYEEDEEEPKQAILKKHVKLELKSSPNEFFSVDDIPVVDGQVSRTDREDKISKGQLKK